MSHEFGDEVAQLLADLADVSRPNDGNRKARKQIDLLHTSQAKLRAKTRKLMDMVHNSVSIVRHDPGFARQFLREMDAMLPLVRDASDPLAWCSLRGCTTGRAGGWRSVDQMHRDKETRGTQFPDVHFQVGICETSLIGIASGRASVRRLMTDQGAN